MRDQLESQFLEGGREGEGEEGRREGRKRRINHNFKLHRFYNIA